MNDESNPKGRAAMKKTKTSREADTLLAQILADGRRAQGYDRYGHLDDEPEIDGEPNEAPTEEELALDLRFSGLFVRASMHVIDELFADIQTLRVRTQEIDITDTWQLARLPERFAMQYTPLFAQQFLVAVVDVSRKWTNGWAPLSSTAEELACRLILDQVEALSEIHGIELEPYWRPNWEDILYEDVDFEWLYGDGSITMSGASREVSGWFESFRDIWLPSPYAHVVRD